MTELEAGLEAVLFAAGDAVPVDEPTQDRRDPPFYRYGLSLIHISRQQTAQRIDEITVFMLAEVAQQTLVQRFFVQRGLEVDLDVVALAAEVPHMRGRGQDERYGQAEVCLLYTSRFV